MIRFPMPDGFIKLYYTSHCISLKIEKKSLLNYPSTNLFAFIASLGAIMCLLQYHDQWSILFKDKVIVFCLNVLGCEDFCSKFLNLS